MVKSEKVQEENEDSGAAAVALLAIGATAGLWAWLRSRREAQPGLAFALEPRSQAQSPPRPTSRPRRDFKESQPRFGYDSRAAFGYVF